MGSRQAKIPQQVPVEVAYRQMSVSMANLQLTMVLTAAETLNLLMPDSGEKRSMTWTPRIATIAEVRDPIAADERTLKRIVPVDLYAVSVTQSW